MSDVYKFDILTANPAPTSGNPAPTNTWQWLRDGSEIPGETSVSYVLSDSDVGSLISVRQIAISDVGQDAAVSSAIGPVKDRFSFVTSNTNNFVTTDGDYLIVKED